MRTGRFRSAGTGRVRVRAEDGSVTTYRIERDPQSGQLVQRLLNAAADRAAAETAQSDDDAGGDA